MFADLGSVLKDLEKDKPTPKPKKTVPDAKKDDNAFQRQIAEALKAQTNRPRVFDAAQKLTISETDLVKSQIRECWNVPAGAKDAENLIINIKVQMNPDGTVRGVEMLDQVRMSSDGFFRAAAESARRATLNKRCQPFKLPPEKYIHWKEFTLRFNPKEMF